MTEPAPPRFSIVIPTYQRREVLLAGWPSLVALDFESFEIIVVVDGSTDGTAEALRATSGSRRAIVIEQANAGAAAARNRGAAAATGKILLFLDDDMEPDRSLLREHDRSHRQGADAVLGHIPLHPDSPISFLSAAVGRSADRRRDRLSAGGPLTLFDLLTGQLSVRRDLFCELGGFDTRFTGGGTFGDEDLDFGYRLLRAGRRVVFNPDALSHQRYVVTLGAHFLQWTHVGSADVRFARKHPEVADQLFALHHRDERVTRQIVRPLAALPVVGSALKHLGAWLVRGLARLRPESARLTPVFARVRALHYWQAVHRAGGLPDKRAVRILAYHAIQQPPGPGVIGSYVVRPETLRRHLRWLRRLGFQFVSGREVLQMVTRRTGLPRRSVLLTFDDGYEDLPNVTLDLLKEAGAMALAFIVSGRIGQTNIWDEALDSKRLRLASLESLRLLPPSIFELGSHSRTHPRLIKLTPEAVHDEVQGASRDLAALGLPAPWAFAYPYGEHSESVRKVVQGSGVALAFSLDAGIATPDSDPYCLPRTEIKGTDSLWTFFKKVWRMPGLMSG